MRLPRRSLAAIAGLLLAALLAGACASVTERVSARNAPLRGPSLAPWSGRCIGSEPAIEFLQSRSALIFGRADELVIDTVEDDGLILTALRRGVATGVSAGSATPLTEDGYFLTAAHCVDEEPFVVLLRDATGHFAWGPGRVVWCGTAEARPVDVALIHVPGVRVKPLVWAALAEVAAGAEVITAGAGLQATRMAAGRILAGPLGDAEAPPRSTHAFETDVPMVPGDSGGPVILASGELVGVSIEIEYRGRGRDTRSRVLRPAPDFLAGRIDEDRAALGTLAP